MPRDTLLDFFEDFSRRSDTFIVHDDGYRVREVSYRDLADAARRFAARLRAERIEPGDKVVIWAENRGEWVAALWACLLTGAVAVPVDYRASAQLVARISGIVQSKVVLVGDEVTLNEPVTGIVWNLRDVALEPGVAPAPESAAVSRTITGTTLAEIIFTSGATADPKGVTITHRNVLANIVPIEREVRKYLRYARPFHPIRFLNLLPLSHMFGQAMATFVPPMLSGTVVFSHGFSPAEILRQIGSRRVSVLVCVPKVLEVLRAHVEREFPNAAAADTLQGKHWLWRWWQYRDVHRLFGFKFWCIVCGAAPLPPDLEAFWRKLGFLVVQGYGLTETAPIVTLNHPFRASQGTVGTPIAGVDVKIAPDGEILVRGENVTSGYYVPEHSPDGGAAGGATESPFEDGWFHTGDIGELDAAGRLVIKGRKKEMIVTAQGLNVFPEDVERALRALPQVSDAAAVGVRAGGEERIHAVLVLAPGASPERIVRDANAGLEDHQRVWSWSIWPGPALPRTEGTQKLKRREIQRWAAGERGLVPASAAEARTVADVVKRFAPGREVRAETTLEELGLSSLDRVELMMALEEAFQTTLDEGALAGSKTVGSIEAVVKSDAPVPGASLEARTSEAGTQAAPPSTSIAFPSWNRSRPAWLLRRLSLPTWILPLGRIFMQMKVEGLEHLAALRGPVIFAANHQSHMDTPAILLALPPRWRYRVAPAMAKEFFKAHFNPGQYSRREWFTNSLNYYLSCEFFNAFPLPQREAGTRQTLRYIGEIVADGYSILIFPEGKRTQSGEIGRFMPGVGMIAVRLGVPVVPVRIEGLENVLHQKMRFPRRGPVRIAFGAAMPLSGDDYAAEARRVEAAVRAL
ncbi:MAG: AMP-binding protein [Acidobacteria bacterium]|nr:AMP-binding protein [Acidobacteriota bacterium]